VIERIRSVSDEVNLLVVDFDTDKYYRSQRIVISGSMRDIEVFESPTSNPTKSAALVNTTHDCTYIFVSISTYFVEKDMCQPTQYKEQEAELYC